MNAEMISAILSAFKNVTSGASHTGSAWVKPYIFPKTLKNLVHQFAIFLKPEVTTPPSQLQAILEATSDVLEQNNVRVGAVRVLGGRYLRQHDVMSRHYGAISKISKQGKEALSQPAQKLLETQFDSYLAEGAVVVGGHQLLERESELTPFVLEVLTRNLGTTKIASGAYALPLKVLGKKYVVLNPFHPYQLQPYLNEENAIIALEGLSPQPWNVLRKRFCGVTDPEAAVPGSLRHTFWKRKDELQLRVVNQGHNGAHVSAGPLEGMVEIARLFKAADESEKWYACSGLTETTFGWFLLRGCGLSEAQMKDLSANPTVYMHDNCTRGPVFDLTEELDAEEAAVRILSIFEP